MAPFTQKPLNKSPLSASLRRRPFVLFGLPFLAVLTLSSFALSRFTQTRYDLRDQRVSTLSKEEELRMKKGRRKWDVREEYWRAKLANELGDDDSYENKRVERLPGQAEWGQLPVERVDPPPSSSE
ncbi:hypothetical protein JCM10212_006258 [Sporobolomyces blumeae]